MTMLEPADKWQLVIILTIKVLIRASEAGLLCRIDNIVNLGATINSVFVPLTKPISGVLGVESMV